MNLLSWTLESSSFWRPLLVCAGVAVLCQIWAILTVWRLRAPLTLRVGCALSRLTALVLSWVLLAQLTYTRQNTEPEAARVDLVIDTSASMKEPTRLPKIASQVEQAAKNFERSHPDIHVQWHTLSGPWAGWPEQHNGLWQTDTDVLKGVEKAIGQPGPFVRGVMLISDGADHGELAQRMSRDDASPSLSARLSPLGVPISTVAVGAPSNEPDIAIDHVSFDQLAFVKVSQSIEISCSVTGLPAGQTSVTLRHGDRILASTELKWSDSRKETQKSQVRLPLRLDTIDAFPLELQIPPQQGETRLENNTFPFIVHSVRDKLRVLHVAGHPSWDSRFLRERFKSLPYIDLVSFYILRTFDNDMSIPEQELALIPFPTEQLFTSELKNFDLIVLQNFDPRPFGMARFLPQVARAVEQEGLGLAMIGGSHSFGSGGFGDSALTPLLPLVPQGSQDARSEEVRLKATPLGEHHRVTRAVASIGTRGPTLPQRHRPLVAGIGSSVLLEAESAGAKGVRSPVLALGRHGKGRTMALATDGMWHWQFSPLATADTQAAYAQLWREALRYLSGDHDMQAVELVLSRHTFSTADDPVVGQLAVAQHQDKPAAARKVRLVARDRESRIVVDSRWPLDASGHANFSLHPLEQGSYALEASLEENAAIQPNGIAREAVAVRPLHREQTGTLFRPHWLSAVAEGSGGKAWSRDQIDEAFRRMPLLQAPPPQVLDLEQKSVWDSPPLLISFLAAWLAAWALERRASQNSRI